MSVVPLLSAAELRDSVKSSGYSPAADADYDRAVVTGTEWVVDRCSNWDLGLIRQFSRDVSASARLFHPVSVSEVFTGDFDTADGNSVTVEVDTTGNGTWETVPVSAWHPEDVVRTPGFPYTRIVVHDPQWPLTRRLAPSVRVTTRWGFAKVPSRAVDAARLVAIETLTGTAIAAGDEAMAGMSGSFAAAERLLFRFMQGDEAPSP